MFFVGGIDNQLESRVSELAILVNAINDRNPDTALFYPVNVAVNG